jgi:hypothetical protein
MLGSDQGPDYSGRAAKPYHGVTGFAASCEYHLLGLLFRHAAHAIS